MGSTDHIRRFRRSVADVLSLMSFFDPQSIPAAQLELDVQGGDNVKTDGANGGSNINLDFGRRCTTHKTPRQASGNSDDALADTGLAQLVGRRAPKNTFLHVPSPRRSLSRANTRKWEKMRANGGVDKGRVKIQNTNRHAYINADT